MLIKHRDFIQIYALARNASQMLESSNCSVNDSSRSFCFIQLSRGRKVRFCLCYLQKSNRYAKSLINANSFPNVMSPPYFFLAECKVGFKGRGGVGRNFLGGGGGKIHYFVYLIIITFRHSQSPSFTHKKILTSFRRNPISCYSIESGQHFIYVYIKKSPLLPPVISILSIIFLGVPSVSVTEVN